MLGIIFDELEKYVGREHGAAGLSQMHGLTGRGEGAYQLDRSYPDQELQLIVKGLSEATGRAPEMLLESFAEAMVPGLLEVYGILVNPRWSFLDLLVNTEGVIHKGVRLSAQSANPPAIQAERSGHEAVTIVYRSQRRLCSVAKGIVRGAANHYGVSITMVEDQCMHRGDPECVIKVSAEE